MTSAAIIVGLIVGLAIAVGIVFGAFGEVEKRLCRELTLLEVTAFALCLPHSLLLLLILPAVPLSKKHEALSQNESSNG